ncbi:MAG: DUF4430 domain-containing protein [Lachnospiraceae bacterium]|nr:DUF4430 domain-containing protein [Lachnospiraceae bacterium]MDY4969293.1 DUF4430 domain-containing protein [Lachnospiraceae bacterium]
MILLSVLLCTAGCTTNSSQITTLEKADQESGENNSSVDLDSMFTDSRMTLPEDGIVSQELMEAIAGKDAVFEFYSTDENMHISYYWSYEGKKIQNAVEQNMKVTFTDDRVDEVKKAANNASVGLGVTLPKENLAAPAKLTVMLSEKWDADMVLLCKLVDGVPERMCDVTVETKKSSQQEYTSLTFPVSEMGDTYYLVGGKTTADEEDEKNSDDPDENTSDNSSNSEDDDGSGSSSAGGSDDQQADPSGSSDGKVHTCKIGIECSTILDNMDKLNKSKSDFVPSDGWILYLSEIEYTPGETVYDILYRVCRDTDIHMEASYTPAYSSYYVEGINQLYEFDCGDLSGWTYSVNGWFPNYGCSKYEVSDGDVVEWHYTCDLGRDVGDQYYGE